MLSNIGRVIEIQQLAGRIHPMKSLPRNDISHFWRRTVRLKEGGFKKIAKR